MQKELVVNNIHKRINESPEVYGKGPHKAVFLDRDGVINKEIGILYDLDQIELMPGAAESIKAFKDTGFIPIIITNQSLIAKNMVSMDYLHQIFDKIENLLYKINGVRVAATYYCPHHPDYPEPVQDPSFIFDCECRKPKPGMLLAAAEDYNIDLKNSYFIGDAERDILAGFAAGVQTYGVRCGHGHKFANEGVTQPEKLFDDIREVKDYILG